MPGVARHSIMNGEHPLNDVFGSAHRALEGRPPSTSTMLPTMIVSGKSSTTRCATTPARSCHREAAPSVVSIHVADHPGRGRGARAGSCGHQTAAGRLDETGPTRVTGAAGGGLGGRGGEPTEIDCDFRV